MTVTANRAIDGALSTVWQPDGPYDMAGTLGILQRGTMDPAVSINDGVAWLCFSTTGGPASLRLTQAPPGTQTSPGARLRPGAPVAASAWGPGAEIAMESVPALLGAGDEWAEFDDPDFLAGLPRQIREARRRHPGLRLPRTGRMVDALVPVILEQKITTIEARRAWRYLAGRYGDQPPGPVPKHMRVTPTPEQFRRIPAWEWHRAGVDSKRSATILRACAAASGLERLRYLSTGPDLTAKLCSIRGIGPWTAAETTQRTHGCPDSVSVGDYHLAAYVGWALAGKPVDDDGMLELLEPWRGHRQRVVRMLVLSGFRKPSFGPRLAPADHRFR
ncbi:MAG TPA: 3-methyladenine DNA glycosylase [Arthrobacter sp.]|nr:3-methyladenine DNA glycosylase [Arthrobacter sp.]